MAEQHLVHECQRRLTDNRQHTVRCTAHADRLL
ncbi:Uncharacterised protein [Mycobacteroides abscessus subsp. abscessus]|nr:Uncharacterised protein [Mycobacteroides abscessus subsp. abscessus]